MLAVGPVALAAAAAIAWVRRRDARRTGIAALAWIAVGIGINVTNPIPSELATSATSLGSAAPGVSADQLIEPVSLALRRLPLRVDRLSGDELAEFQGRDWLQGRVLVEPVPGIARGITVDGSLLVEQADGSIVPARAGRPLLG